MSDSMPPMIQVDFVEPKEISSGSSSKDMEDDHSDDSSDISPAEKLDKRKSTSLSRIQQLLTCMLNSRHFPAQVPQTFCGWTKTSLR